jgi:hypothetical protein
MASATQGPSLAERGVDDSVLTELFDERDTWILDAPDLLRVVVWVR